MELGFSQYSNALAGGALTTTFSDTYTEWLRTFETLQASVLTAQQAVDSAAEQAGALTRRLSRVASSLVGVAGANQIKAVQYMFVALIDENLLFADWVGQSLWQATPLEFRLFGSRTAGERVPALIERLLHERDPVSRDLANVCLQCLLLGFQGKLRGVTGATQHAEWRRELFVFVYLREADERRVGFGLERPCAIEPVRRRIGLRLLPDNVRLLLIAAIIILSLVGVGQLFWWDIYSHLIPELRSNMGG